MLFVAIGWQVNWSGCQLLAHCPLSGAEEQPRGLWDEVGHGMGYPGSTEALIAFPLSHMHVIFGVGSPLCKGLR